MKKVISLFLSVAMLLSIVSVVDFSAFADVQTGNAVLMLHIHLIPQQVCLQ